MKGDTLMRLMISALMLFALAGSVGCGPTDSTDSGDQTRDLEAITALRKENVAANNAGDVSALLAQFTDDAVLLPPGQLPVRGKAALEAFSRPFHEQYDVETEQTAEEVVVAGDWAYEWGMLTGTARPLAGGEAMQADMKYLYVYERQPDGSWKIAVDIYNNNVPSAPPGHR